MKRRRKITRGKQAWRVWADCWARGTVEPLTGGQSQELGALGWTAFLLP